MELVIVSEYLVAVKDKYGTLGYFRIPNKKEQEEKKFDKP